MVMTCEKIHHIKCVPLKAYNPINSYKDLIAYCLRRLGGGTVVIEVTDQQCLDRLTDALQLYREYHAESLKPKWLVLRTTEADMRRGWYSLPPEILDVLDVMNFSSLAGTPALEGLDDPEYWFKNAWWGINSGVTQGSTDAWGIGQGGTGGLVSYETSFEWIQTMRDILVPVTEFTFRSRSHKLELYKMAQKMRVDWPLVLHVNEMVNPSDPENGWVWDNMWLKEYLTAILGVQWAQNLLKYTNVTLTGRCSNKRIYAD